MPSRRLNDRIRELCGKAIVAKESEIEPVLVELNTALRQHSLHLRKLAAETLVGAVSPVSDRRNDSLKVQSSSSNKGDPVGSSELRPPNLPAN
jgi:hypothetical protein